MKRIVIFDMDGTLIDSKKDITISVNFVRKINHNLPPLSEEFIVEAINKKERNLAKIFYNTDTYEERDRELFERHYKEQCIQNPYLFEGVQELLKTLKAHKVCMGVATNAPTPFAIAMLRHLKIASFFEKIVGADQAAPKPDPQALQIILKACAYSKDHDKAWMVGDNPKDIQAAKNAGIEAIYALWGFQSECRHPIRAKHPSDIAKIVLA